MNGRLCGLKILDMARRAGSAQAYKLPDRFSLVATLAIDRGMGSHQRESVLVPLDGLQRGIPAADRVASVAFSTELPAMNVGMAISAFGSYFREDKVLMALAAVDALMHAAYREGSLIVVEIRMGPNVVPADLGMATSTGNCQISMRTSCPPLDDLSVGKVQPRQKKKKSEEKISTQSRTDVPTSMFCGRRTIAAAEIRDPVRQHYCNFRSLP